MASTWGKVLDQASIIGSAFREIEKACIKATRHDNSIPKEKHVRKLILCTHERADLSEEIYSHLAKRMELPDWIVVLKTLVVFHRLFRDGSPRFLGDLKWKGTIFPLSRFSDPTSEEGRVQSVFIRKYALYLEEKVLVYRALKMEFEKDPMLLKGLSVEDSFVRLPKLQRQLDALIHCQTSAEAITNTLTSLAFEMLLKDSFKLYRGLNDAVITLLESYFNLEKSLAITALDIYKAFMRETSAIIAMYEMARKKFTLELPDLKHAPTTLVNSMEDYIREVDDGRKSDQRQSQQHSKPQSVASPTQQGSRAPQPPSPHQEAPLFDAFSEPVRTSPQRPVAATASSLIDPFGVSVSSPPSRPSQSPNNPIFDPFGDVFSSPPPATTPPSQSSFPPVSGMSRQSSSQPIRSPNAQNYPSPPPSSSAFGADPFAPTPQTFATNNNPQQNKVSYEEKAQHIKAAFAPPLMPMSPPTGSPAPTSQYNYPKPNYNVSLSSPQQPAANPYGSNQLVTQQQAYNQFNAGPQYSNNPFNSPAPANPYASPPPQQSQQPANPFFL